MGVIFKPDERKKRKNIDKALEDLDPSIRDAVIKLTENYKGEDLERKINELKEFKKSRDLIDKK